MTDIDFDELDKAVNSLMGGAPKPSGGQDDATPQQKTLSIGDSLQPGQAPEFNKIEEAAQKIGSDALVTDSEQLASTVKDLDGSATGDLPINIDATSSPSPVTIPAPPMVNSPAMPVESSVSPAAPEVPTSPTVPSPETGRFMDVIHPSSDMRTATPPNITVPDRMSFQSPAAPSAPIAQPQPVPPAASEMPAGVNPIPVTPVTATGSEPTSLPQSPFLPNPSVEKRPLGAPSAETGSQDMAGSMMDQMARTEETHSKQSAGTTMLNGEVQNNPGNDDAQKSLNASDFDRPVSQEEQTLQGIESRDVGGGNPLGVSGEPSVDTVESGDTEKLSNVKPWKAKKQELSDKTHDMYSVNSSGSAKQKSGMFKVVIIIAIIVLFAAGGAGAYFFLGIGK